MNVAKLLVPVAVTLALSCGEQSLTPPSQLNLDRPMDVAFACFGGMRVTDGRPTGSKDDPIVFSAMPSSLCEGKARLRMAGEPAPVFPGQEDLKPQGGQEIPPQAFFAFILQAGPGTVALAEFLTKQPTDFTGGDVSVLDSDPLTPGKNGISVGEDPIAIATDTAGCKVLTANAGSCDLSVLDVSSAVDFNAATPVRVDRLEVTNAAGTPIRAKPAAMVAEPAAEVYGNRCSETASGIVYVAYPSCSLVAAVDAATGTIVRGVKYDAGGVPSIVDGNVTCADECGGGAPAASGPRPVTLDLRKDPRTGDRRLIIGADNLPAITVAEIDDVTAQPLSVRQFALEVTDPAAGLGVTQVALSPVIGTGGTIGVINDDTAPGGEFQFVYAIATDHTIRVVDVLTTLRECDTQIDPRYVRDIRSVRQLSCLKLGDPTTPNLLRRAGARGPGIELIGDGVPLSVAIIRSQQIDNDPRSPDFPPRLVGYFAMVTASNGVTFIVNIDDDGQLDLFNDRTPLETPMPALLAHQLRDSVPERNLLAFDDNAKLPVCDLAGPSTDAGLTAGARIIATPGRQIPNQAIAVERTSELPGIRQLRCEGLDTFGGKSVTRAVSELSFAAPVAVRDQVYPDIRALRSEEAWALIWEGTLSLDRPETAVDGPVIRESEMRVDTTGLYIVDQSKPFCDAGVEPHDFIQLRGCDPQFGNNQCPSGYRCFVHPASQVTGLGACLLEDEADRLADACKDFLTSTRRYTVATTKSGALTLSPRRVTLTTTPIEGCASDDQCTALADYATRAGNSIQPRDDTDTDPHKWTCNADPSRAAIASGKRCQLRCDSNADCLTGTICQGGNGNGKQGFCMEGVIPPQACINAPQRYEIHAGEAFTVIGDRTGFVHPVIDVNGTCKRDPNANPMLTGRIPLVVPACDPTADLLSGRKPDGTFEPNPCATTVTQTESAPRYLDATCALDDPASEVVDREAPAIRFRTRGITMTIVDPTYPGDQACFLDRKGVPNVNTTTIPLVLPNYQINFRQTSGYLPLTLPIGPSFPVKVVRGPTDSIWVIDEGDFLSTQLGQPSTRGKVFRVEPHSITTVNVLE